VGSSSGLDAEILKYKKPEKSDPKFRINPNASLKRGQTVSRSICISYLKLHFTNIVKQYHLQYHTLYFTRFTGDSIRLKVVLFI
jgi:hypothetical protein